MSWDEVLGGLSSPESPPSLVPHPPCPFFGQHGGVGAGHEHHLVAVRVGKHLGSWPAGAIWELEPRVGQLLKSPLSSYMRADAGESGGDLGIRSSSHTVQIHSSPWLGAQDHCSPERTSPRAASKVPSIIQRIHQAGHRAPWAPT